MLTSLAPSLRLVHEARHVLIAQMERLLVHSRLWISPGTFLARRECQALDDETVVRLVDRYLAHAALIEHCP